MVRIGFAAILLSILVAQTAAAQSYADQYRQAQSLRDRANAGQLGLQTRGPRASQIPRDLPKHDQPFGEPQGKVTTEQTKPVPGATPTTAPEGR